MHSREREGEAAPLSGTLVEKYLFCHFDSRHSQTTKEEKVSIAAKEKEGVRELKSIKTKGLHTDTGQSHLKNQVHITNSFLSAHIRPTAIEKFCWTHGSFVIAVVVVDISYTHWRLY